MSINPRRPMAKTSGIPASGSGSSTPSRTMRNWPRCSVMSMSPLGRKAIAHGLVRPFSGTTRNDCSWVWNTCGSAGKERAERQSSHPVRSSGSCAAAGAASAARKTAIAAAAAHAACDVILFTIGIT